MFRTKINGQVLAITFRHDTLSGTTAYAIPYPESKPAKRPDPIAIGRSYLALGDKFSKPVGRKIALARLLTELGLDKETRRQVWQEYFASLG